MKYYFLLVLSGLAFLCFSCHYVHSDKEVVINPEYIRTHPDCIPGIYLNFFDSLATDSLVLKTDNTFVHHFQKGKKEYVNKGTWDYEYYERGQIGISLKDFYSYVEEGGQGQPGGGGYFSNCCEIHFDVDYEYPNFIKVSALTPKELEAFKATVREEKATHNL